MAKVVYSISKRSWDNKLTGLGNLSNGTLWVKNRNGKWMAFEDVLKYCHPIPGKANQYSGNMTLAYMDVPVYDKEKNNSKYVDYMEVEYHIWFKYVA